MARVRFFVLGDLVNTDAARPIQGIIGWAQANLSAKQATKLRQGIMRKVAKLQQLFERFNLADIEPEPFWQQVNKELFADIVAKDSAPEATIPSQDFWPIWNSICCIDADALQRLALVAPNDAIISETNVKHLEHLDIMLRANGLERILPRIFASCVHRVGKVDLYKQAIYQVVGEAENCETNYGAANFQFWFGDIEAGKRQEAKAKLGAEIVALTRYAKALGTPEEQVYRASARQLLAQHFFVSSMADANLAIDCIDKIKRETSHAPIYWIPLSPVVMASNFPELPAKLSNRGAYHESDHEWQQLLWQIRAVDYLPFVGVASAGSNQRYQRVLQALGGQAVLVNPFMYEESDNPAFQVQATATPPKATHLVVPTKGAQSYWQERHPGVANNVLVYRPRQASTTISKAVHANRRGELGIVENNQRLLYVSGTTQAAKQDILLLRSILQSLASGQHPEVQVRICLHPGKLRDTSLLAGAPNDATVAEMYVASLLALLGEHRAQAGQCKLVFNAALSAELEEIVPDFARDYSHFTHRLEPNGNLAAAVAEVADGVAQAVPGAAINNALDHVQPALVLPGYQSKSFHGGKDCLHDNTEQFMAAMKVHNRHFGAGVNAFLRNVAGPRQGPETPAEIIVSAMRRR